MNRIESMNKPLQWIMALLLVFFVAGCGGGGGNAPQSSAKAITDYSLDGNTGTISETEKTITVIVPYGTDVTELVTTFITTGTTVMVGTTVQTSGTTPNNFTNPVPYTVTAADNTSATYVVTIAANPAKAITAYSLAGVAGTINEADKTIAVTVPYGTNLASLAAAFTTTGVSVKVGTQVQTTGLTLNDFRSQVTYTVTADDTTTATYTVTVSAAMNFAKAITSYVLSGVAGTINETQKTIAVNMASGTNVTALVAVFTSTGAGSVTVGGTPQVSGTTQNAFTNPVQYTVTAADNSTATYTVTVTLATNSAKAITAYSIAGVTGTIDETAQSIAVILPYGTNVTALIATFSSSGTGPVTIGSTAQVSGTTPNDFTAAKTYTVTAADTTTVTYTVTVSVAMNFAKAITAYSLDGVAGAIDETLKTIAVTVPNGTNVTALIATFTSTGTSVKIGSVVQASAVTVNNFSGPVTYTVVAADGTTVSYTVTVTVAAAAGPNLRRTASFAVLSSGSSITATGTTAVTGDVGATSFTGGGTLSITAGTDYSAGSGQPFVDAQTDLPSVISDANDTTLFPCGSSIAPDLSGVVLTPGVTCINADAAILNSGVVTLNGAGVYMIRTTGALTPAASSSVAFGGTATNANTTVFWVVGSADIGTPSTWMGTILTGGAVVLGDTDTLVKGRVLTTAGVTLSNNTITIP